MRPGLISPGNQSETSVAFPEAQASMRPGLISPGNQAEREALAQRGEASMRPGLISPGNRCCSICGRRSIRCFNEAGTN